MHVLLEPLLMRPLFRFVWIFQSAFAERSDMAKQRWNFDCEVDWVKTAGGYFSK